MLERRTRTSLFAAATAALLVPATALAAAPASSAATAALSAAATSSATTDPFDLVYSAQFEDGKIVESSVGKLSRRAFGQADLEKKDVNEDPPREGSKLQPALEKLLASGEEKQAQILVTYEDPFTVPAFPVPAIDEDRDSDTNQRKLTEARELVRSIENERAGVYQKQTAVLEELGGKVTKTYWLIQGLSVSLPLNAVSRLVEQDDVRYLELADEQWPLPDDGNPDNDAIDARAQLASDPYFNLGQTSGWIGLLDGGVRTTHDVFNAPDHIAIAEDLTGDGDPGDQCNHGTASAALITGNSRLGGNWRGLSAISVDSWDIAGNDCSTSSDHVVEGFQQAVSWLDRVIVAEVQIGASETSATSTAADNAYDAGSVVVAANGNFGAEGAGSVRSPANAHKVLGIGAADLQTDALKDYSGRGPTTDSRYKPDLVFPTNVETARSGSDTAVGSFGGTSCATPIAGGAVALMRNWMRGGVGSIDAGHVYSQAILGGQTTYPFNNDTGAGPFVLGTGGHAWWGKVNATQGGVVNIPISVAPGKTKFEGSLWWPESTNRHNDVDLALVSPYGTVFDTSTSVVSVFERAGVLSGLYSGTWTLRITGYSVSGTQSVYWSGRTR